MGRGQPVDAGLPERQKGFGLKKRLLIRMGSRLCFNSPAFLKALAKIIKGISGSPFSCQGILPHRVKFPRMSVFLLRFRWEEAGSGAKFLLPEVFCGNGKLKITA